MSGDSSGRRRTSVPPSAGALQPARRLLLACVPALLLACPAGAGEIQVWIESPARKVQPTTAPGPSQELHLQGARGAYESSQIVVRAPGAPLSGVALEATDLEDGAGNLIPASRIAFFREVFLDFTDVPDTGGTLDVPRMSPTGDGRIPDALVPFADPYGGGTAGAPFAVPAGENQPVWLDLHIPSEAAPGTYTGAVTVTAAGCAPKAVPLSVEVWRFSLPDQRSVTAHFRLSLGPFIRYHGGTYDCSGSDCWLSWNDRARSVVRRYQEMAHAHRLDPGQYFVRGPEPGGCEMPADWSEYDAGMEPYMDGSYFADGVPSGRLSVPFSPGWPPDWGAPQSCADGRYTALAGAWANHLKERGWFDRAVVYAYDEPHDPGIWGEIGRHSLLMQAADGDWKARVMDTEAPTPSSAPILNDALGIYCVCLACYDGWAYDPLLPPSGKPFGRAEWSSLFAQGIRLWFYESNAQGPPYPTFATNTLLGMEPRMMMWGAWYEGAAGFLYWDISAWDGADPWGPNVMFGKTGDGVLLYPGNHDGLDAPLGSPQGVAIDGPVPSFRLKVVRQGLQDWALFLLAEERGAGAIARAEVARAYSQLGGCTWVGCPPPLNGQDYWKTDGALLEEIRRNVAAAIEATYGAPGDCDGDGGISIGEIQRAITMFLGLAPAGCEVDRDGDGSVSVGEVQTVINGYLGIAPLC